MYNDPKCHRINEYKGGKKRGKGAWSPSTVLPLLFFTLYHSLLSERLKQATRSYSMKRKWRRRGCFVLFPSSLTRFLVLFQHSKRFDRPLPSSKNPHFQNEAKCTSFLVTLTPRFTDFFTDFEKKPDCFAV